ncbi:MAG: nucleoside-diphosphate sugar epimerase/dehydratase [Acidimicrobiia bacterium]|nr:nucleoside-diphosphate sugar epimerase/dehydratase [Acidimicrobiia bacterium]
MNESAGRTGGNAADSSENLIWARLAARTVRVRSDVIIVALDAALTTAAFAAMLLLRFDGAVPDDRWSKFIAFIPVAVCLAVICNLAWGLYGQLWKHASLFEARRLVLSGLTLTSILVLFEWKSRDVPISVIVTGAIVATFLMALLRFQSRLFSFRRASGEPGMRAVVVGAGDAGARLVNEMLRNPRAGFRPVAIVDQNRSLHGRSFAGIDVVGGLDGLTNTVMATGAHVLIFPEGDDNGHDLRDAAAAAERADIPLKIAPDLSSSLGSGASLRDIRDVQIEDLLGRDQVEIDMDAVRAMLVGERVLITGAGGSIGSEIARQVADCDPALLVLLDHDETHLHDIASELPTANVVQALADIRERRRILSLFNKFRPTVVFHAAAHKHVPLLESNPTEAALTNVVGTSNVLDAASEVGVERLVFISTDKAVYPSSMMGASKRLGEQLVVSRAPAGAAYCAVRFGNVLGSRGSVVPTFMKQIAAGGPVTVTDRRMERYFMSIAEAVRLVLQAGAIAEPADGGSVFMLDMGEPVRIYDLAERMIRLAGHHPGVDIEIEVTGMRPGEKLAEVLTAVDENETPTSHPAISSVASSAIPQDTLEEGVDRLGRLAIDLDEDTCGLALRTLAGAQHGEPQQAVPERRLQPAS